MATLLNLEIIASVSPSHLLTIRVLLTSTLALPARLAWPNLEFRRVSSFYFLLRMSEVQM